LDQLIFTEEEGLTTRTAVRRGPYPTPAHHVVSVLLTKTSCESVLDKDDIDYSVQAQWSGYNKLASDMMSVTSETCVRSAQGSLSPSFLAAAEQRSLSPSSLAAAEQIAAAPPQWQLPGDC